MHNHLIFLIGMPAAGKTFWAQQVSEKYDLSFIDLDQYISRHESASVPALFAQYGEKGFREREHEYLKKIITTTAEPTIIACGGGTPCFLNNMELMKDAGLVIYLQTDITQLLENLKNSDEIRPLLRGKPDLFAHLQDMLHKRGPVYEQAHHILHTKDISIATFAKIIAHV